MKCLNCGREFSNVRWPASFRARLKVYRRTGQIPGHRFGTFTCSVKCDHVISKIRAAIQALEVKK